MRHREDRLLALDAASWPIRHQAFRDLLAQGASSLETLIAGAAHPRPRARAACIALLDHLADERCDDTLRAALCDPSPLVRRVAAHQLGLQPFDRRAVEALERVLATARDPGLLARARFALGTLRAANAPRQAAG
jgi:HEAT repeat protein